MVLTTARFCAWLQGPHKVLTACGALLLPAMFAVRCSLSLSLFVSVHRAFFCYLFLLISDLFAHAGTPFCCLFFSYAGVVQASGSLEADRLAR